MKKLLLLLIIIPFLGYGQTNTAVVAATNMNIMYHNNIKNPISIAVEGIDNSDIRVLCSGGNITTVNKDKGEYSVIVTANHPSKVKVSVQSKNNMGEYDVISTHEFRIRYAAGNVIRAKIGDGEYSKNEIKTNEFWSEIPGFDFPVRFYISSFEVVTIGTQKVTTKVSGNKVNSQAKKEIEKLEAGQTVVFQKFLVRQDGMKNNFEILKDKYVYIIKESPDKVIE